MWLGVGTCPMHHILYPECAVDGLMGVPLWHRLSYGTGVGGAIAMQGYSVTYTASFIREPQPMSEVYTYRDPIYCAACTTHHPVQLPW